MQVIAEPFEDAGEKDASGFHDYYYSGVVYRLVFPDRELHARRYDDTPGEAHFLAFTAARGGKRCLFETIPYNDPEFAVAAAYLRDTVGADSVRILLPTGYSSVEFTRFPASRHHPRTIRPRPHVR